MKGIKMNNTVIKLLKSVQNDMHFHNIEYSQAFLDLTKAIDIMEKEKFHKLVIKEK
tara:strand:- start:273 stop:440 length:168 start_codon:yes stop_codon:yes gene_type:complete